MDVLSNLKFIAGILYGIPCMVIYGIVAFVIYKKPYRFYKTFYKLFIVGFWMNFVCYLSSYLTMRIPSVTHPNGPFWDFYSTLNRNNTDTIFPLSFFHTLHFEFAYTQYLFNMILCLNRYSSLHWWLRDEKYWKKAFWPIVVALFALPFVFFTHQIFFNFSFFNWNPISQHLAIDSTYDKKYIYRCLMPFLIIVTLVNTLLNVFTCILYRKEETERLLKNPLFKMPGRSHFSIAYASFFIELFLATLTVIIFYITNCADMESVITYILYNIVVFFVPLASDALTLSQPFLMLYHSKKTRNEVRSFLGIPQKPNVPAETNMEVIANSESETSSYL